MRNDEVKLFRGAVIHAIPSDNLLFHNHEGGNYRYAYPLIQYKRINQCAGIVCLGDGVEAIGSFFMNYQGEMRIGERTEHMEIDYLRPAVFNVQVCNDMFYYNLHRWLPLNADNYRKYQSIDSMTDKLLFLEKILVGNILSFCKGVNIKLEQQVICKIVECHNTLMVTHKGVKLMAFNLRFKSNVSLPDYIGIGKNASLNYGIVTK